MGEIDIANLVSHLIIYMVVLLLAISAHEAGHAWMSYKFGDDTAYMLGRVTLNPVAHTDPIGTLLIPIVAFILGSMGGALGSIPLITPKFEARCRREIEARGKARDPAQMTRCDRRQRPGIHPATEVRADGHVADQLPDRCLAEGLEQSFNAVGLA